MTRPLALALAILALATPALAQVTARAVDGDTLEVSGVRYRLWGIDAPEQQQTCTRGGQVWTCGHEATAALARLIAGKTPACEHRATDRYGRSVALCRVEGRDLSAEMVEWGMARAFVRYSLDYVAHERRAAAARRGIWAGEHTAPWEWRAARKGGR